MARRWLLATIALLCAGCQVAYFGVINVGAQAELVAPRDGVVYDTALRLGLDVHRPDAVPRAPVVVFFHGGAWQHGERRSYRFVGSALAAHGIVAVMPDYRRYPSVRFPAFVEDGARAVAWTFAHAERIGGDPKRIYLGGHSSGAHIAALLATDARYLAAVGHRPGELAGVIGVAGPYDFVPITHPLLLEIFGAEERHALSQPVNFIDGDEPPFLLLHGDADRRVAVFHSERLAQRLSAAARPVQLRRYAGVGHVRILSALRYPKLAPTLADIVAFVSAPGATRTTPLEPAAAAQ
jgi:acetyl esterase/lipase